MMTRSPTTCRPHDVGRPGATVGNGACTLVAVSMIAAPVRLSIVKMQRPYRSCCAAGLARFHADMLFYLLPDVLSCTHDGRTELRKERGHGTPTRNQEHPRGSTELAKAPPLPAGQYPAPGSAGGNTVARVPPCRGRATPAAEGRSGMQYSCRRLTVAAGPRTCKRALQPRSRS